MEKNIDKIKDVSIKEEIETIRRKTFNSEFKGLVSRIEKNESDRKETQISKSNEFIKDIHKLFYATKFIEDNSIFLYNNDDLVNSYSNKNFIFDQLEKEIFLLGFSNYILLKYSFFDKAYLPEKYSDEQNGKNFIIAYEDPLYNKLEESPLGIVEINENSLSENGYLASLKKITDMDKNFYLHNPYLLVLFINSNKPIELNVLLNQLKVKLSFLFLKILFTDEQEEMDFFNHVDYVHSFLTSVLKISQKKKDVSISILKFNRKDMEDKMLISYIKELLRFKLKKSIIIKYLSDKIIIFSEKEQSILEKELDAFLKIYPELFSSQNFNSNNFSENYFFEKLYS